MKLLDCNGHGSSILCVRWPLNGHDIPCHPYVLVPNIGSLELEIILLLLLVIFDLSSISLLMQGSIVRLTRPLFQFEALIGEHGKVLHLKLGSEWGEV